MRNLSTRFVRLCLFVYIAKRRRNRALQMVSTLVSIVSTLGALNRRVHMALRGGIRFGLLLASILSLFNGAITFIPVKLDYKKKNIGQYNISFPLY